MIKAFSRYRTVVIFSLIIVCAVLLRFWTLSEVPYGFQTDEAIIADNARSILETGRDTNNVLFPLQTEVFGDYNPTGAAYLTILPIKILGSTIFATRSVGALLSVLTVVAVFFFAYALFENVPISLLSSFFFAFSPWDIILSRSSEETIASLFFLMVGFALLVFGIRKMRLFPVFLSTLVLFISYFMYFTPRFFVPAMFFFALAIFYKQIAKQRVFLISTIFCFVFLSVLSVYLAFGINSATGRLTQVSIFTATEGRFLLAEQIREAGSQQVPADIVRLAHNKAVDYLLIFSRNYLQYFSGDYLFVDGGLPVFLEIPNAGLVYLVELPLFLYGLFLLCKKRNPYTIFLLVWLLFSPVIAALTADDVPNIRRSLTMVPAIEIIAAYALYSLPRKRTYMRIILSFFFIVYAWFVFYFLFQYFIQAKMHRPWYRNNGFGAMMQIVNANYPTYDKVIMSKSGGGYPLVLFFSQYDPKMYLAEGAPKDQDYKGFGKFIFVPNDCPSINASVQLPVGTKVLYVDRGTCNTPTKKSGRKYTDILREDGTIGFRVVY